MTFFLHQIFKVFSCFHSFILGAVNFVSIFRYPLCNHINDDLFTLASLYLLVLSEELFSIFFLVGLFSIDMFVTFFMLFQMAFMIVLQHFYVNKLFHYHNKWLVYFILLHTSQTVSLSQILSSDDKQKL